MCIIYIYIYIYKYMDRERELLIHGCLFPTAAVVFLHPCLDISGSTRSIFLSIIQSTVLYRLVATSLESSFQASGDLTTHSCTNVYLYICIYKYMYETLSLSVYAPTHTCIYIYNYIPTHMFPFYTYIYL